MFFTKEYSYERLRSWVKQIVGRSVGRDREHLAWQICRYMRWEWEDFERSRDLRCTLEAMEIDRSRRRFLDEDPEAFQVPLTLHLFAPGRTYELETIVLSPKWLSKTLEPGGLRHGGGTLFILDYDEATIETAVERSVNAIGAQTIDELECYLSRLGRIVEKRTR